jgi:hypothetical protein
MASQAIFSLLLADDRTEVWEIMEDSRVTGKVLQAFNATFLTLVPKEGQAIRPSNTDL